MKLVVSERESSALSAHLEGRSIQISSGLARVEVVRAARAVAPARLNRARAVVDELEIIDLDDRLLRAAADLEGSALRSLDAIHVASARSLGDDLKELITYDSRMARAAEGLDLPVVSPA